MTASEVAPASVATEPQDLRPAWLRSDRWVLAGFVLLALALRAPNLGRAFWVDEGITIGISSHPIGQIPRLLRHDGSPPLFYFLLHFWMRAFGTSEPATHTLPLLISLIAIPVAFLAGRELFHRRAASIAAAALVATNPFLNWYSTETRMYTLVVLLSLVGVTLAWRAFRDRRLLDAAGAALTYAALLYTHDWAIYLTGGTGLVLLWLAWSRGDRRLAAWVLAGGATALILWLPWLPSFVYQANNTAAPWAVQPGIGDFFADPSTALAGTIGFIVVPLLVIGVWLGRRDVAAGDRLVAGAVGTMALATTVAGFLGAEIEPSWTVRYLAVIVGPYLIAAAGALSAGRTGRRVLWAACGALVLWAVIGQLLPNPNARYAKSNVAAIAAAVSSRMHAGDAVIVTQTEQLAVAYHYLPGGLHYMSPTGPVSDPRVVDWRDIVSRLQHASPCAALGPTLNSLPVGATVLEINPVRKLGATGSAWSRAVNGQVIADNSFLRRDPALTAVGFYTEGLSPRPFSPVDGVLFQKTSAAPACG